MAGHLLHIGYTKAASSFLQQWFMETPQLHYRHQTFFGFERCPHIYEAIHQQQLSEVKYWVTSDEDFAFWKGPINIVGIQLQDYPVKAYQREMAATLRSLIPEATVLMVTRGFAGIMRSAYSQYIRVGGILTFQQWLNAYKHLMQDFWDYDFVYNIYTEAFGTEQVMVLPYELLADDPQQFVQHISRRLGLEAAVDLPQVVNASLSAEKLAQYRGLSNKFYRMVKKLAGAEQQQQWYTWYSSQLVSGKLDRCAALFGGSSAEVAEPDEAELKALFANKGSFCETIDIFKLYRNAYLQ